MAALTWRNVDTPNFGGANAGFAAANHLLQKSVEGLTTGLGDFQKQQVSNNEGQVLMNALRIRDPKELQARIADGTLSSANPETIQALGSQISNLLSQSVTKQNMDQNQHKYDREVSQEGIADAAKPEQARMLGLTGALANLPVAEQQGVATNRSALDTAALNRTMTRSNLVSNEISQAGGRLSNEAASFRNNNAVRDDAATQGATSKVGYILSGAATPEEGLRAFEETPWKSPQEREIARGQLEKAWNQRLYAPPDVASPPHSSGGSGSPKIGNTPKTGGVKPMTISAPQEAAAYPAARDALLELGRTMSQNTSKGVLADVEKNLNDTRDPLVVSGDIAKLVTGAKPGAIQSLMANSLSKYPGLSAADVQSAIARSPGNTLLGSTTIGDGVGVDDASLKTNLQDLATGNADYMTAGNQVARSMHGAITSAVKSLDNAKSALADRKKRQKYQTGIDTSEAEDRVARSQQALDDVVTRYQETPELHPVRKPEEKVKPAGEKYKYQRRYPSL